MSKALPSSLYVLRTASTLSRSLSLRTTRASEGTKLSEEKINRTVSPGTKAVLQQKVTKSRKRLEGEGRPFSEETKT